MEGGHLSPQQGITLGEVVSLAVLIHRTYNGRAMPEGMSGLQYALNTGIVAAGQYDDYTAPAARLTASVFPINADDRSVTWTSSEPRAAVVDGDGTVTAIQPGAAVIIASTPAGAAATCSVRVSDYW